MFIPNIIITFNIDKTLRSFKHNVPFINSEKKLLKLCNRCTIMLYLMFITIIITFNIHKIIQLKKQLTNILI